MTASQVVSLVPSRSRKFESKSMEPLVNWANNTNLQAQVLEHEEPATGVRNPRCWAAASSHSYVNPISAPMFAVRRHHPIARICEPSRRLALLLGAIALQVSTFEAT
jgi:hypothetical protein